MQACKNSQVVLAIVELCSPLKITVDFVFKAKNHDFNYQLLGEYIENNQNLLLQKDYSIQCYLTRFCSSCVGLTHSSSGNKIWGKWLMYISPIGFLELFREVAATTTKQKITECASYQNNKKPSLKVKVVSFCHRHRRNCLTLYYL